MKLVKKVKVNLVNGVHVDELVLDIGSWNQKNVIGAHLRGLAGELDDPLASVNELSVICFPRFVFRPILESIEKKDDATVKNTPAFVNQETASKSYARLWTHSYIHDPTFQLSHAARGTVSGHEERAEPQHQGKIRVGLRREEVNFYQRPIIAGMIPSMMAPMIKNPELPGFHPVFLIPI
nr:hypothetical protein [Candidatus Sigynarchaeota archaeon]